MANKTLIIGDKGYIGSALKQHIEASGIDKNHTLPNWTWEMQGYDTIILLAGHSSMPMGRDDPDGAWENNVVKFKALLDNLRDNQRLIYMSSASVYNNIKGYPDETCAEFHPMNMYDLTKYTIDQLAILANKHTYGLRLCTVNGYAPVLRVDLMLNKMKEDAVNKGVVTIKNADLERPITDIQDVCRGIKAIIDSKQDKRGIYNFCTLKGYTVGDYAKAVTEKFGGQIQNLGNESHYVYGADTTKFEEAYNFKFNGTLDSILESLKMEPNEKVIRTAN